MNCRCENPRHADHAGGPCAAVATETDNYCKPCHDNAADEAMAAIKVPILRRGSSNKSSAKSSERKTVIEVRWDEDKEEHSLVIQGSAVENAEVHENALHRGWFYL